MKRKAKRIKVFLMLALILCITVGYAALTTTLNITGNSQIMNAKWDIHFTNLKVDGTSVEASTPAKIASNKTTVNYVVDFVKQGDSYSFSVDVVNEGTIDGMINLVTNTGIAAEHQKYLDYSIKYADGVEVKPKDGLGAGDKRTIKVSIKYKDNVNQADLPLDDKNINANFTVEYVQADDTVRPDVTVCKANKNITVDNGTVCKRATTLHTEECKNSGCYASGYTASGSKGTAAIVYGKCGTKGTLKSGDAFDCDVNNDGTYDSETERFYYVSPSYDNGTYSDSYVTLMYYNNTTNGLPDNTRAGVIEYDSSDQNYYGPRNGYVNLPSVSQWSHPNLVSNMTRQIRTDTGATSTGRGTIESFTYTNKAARFLTAQEVNKACNITVGTESEAELESCNYLMENTNYSTSDFTYGYWLETPNLYIVWTVYSFSRSVNDASPCSRIGFGARPAITVLKSKISY